MRLAYQQTGNMQTDMQTHFSNRGIASTIPFTKVKWRVFSEQYLFSTIEGFLDICGGIATFLGSTALVPWKVIIPAISEQVAKQRVEFSFEAIKS